MTVTPALEVRGLTVGYRTRSGWSRAVDDVSFSIAPGQVLALVGESGSGKTTIAHSVIGVLPGTGSIQSGGVLLNGVDIASWGDRRLRAVRGRRIALVPQDPSNSLNPVRTIGANLAEVMRIHRWGDPRATRRRVISLLERVGIPDPELRARQYPHQLSGGMRQRVLIASAIALKPDVIIADEPTSALDVTLQHEILTLFAELLHRGRTLLIVSHDFGVVSAIADYVLVMKDGEVIEEGLTADVMTAPRERYTRDLVDAVPRVGRSRVGVSA